MRTPTTRTLTLAGLLLVPACQNFQTPRDGGVGGSGFRGWPTPDAAAKAEMDGLVRDASGGRHNRRVSVWLGNASGAPLYRWQAETPRGAASAIKTAYLLEWFDAYRDRLDQPVPAIAKLLQDPKHPAIEHFNEPVQAEIRRDLSQATVREIGHHMIHGRTVSNAVYNAAANVVTAMCGGPEGLTQRIHARFPAAADMNVRRYMLAARDVTGDNTMTAAALGQVLQALADRRVPEMDAGAMEAARRVLRVAPSKWLGDHYFKSGSLDSEPQVRIRSGWFEQDDRCLVYVVMAEQTRPDQGADDAGEEMGAAVAKLADALVAAVQAPITTR